MRVLLIGGTGLISTGIIKHLLPRGAQITMFNRGQRENPFPPEVKKMEGDRNAFDSFERTFANARFDVVIDMICFNAEQAASAIRAFGDRCKHFIFCSTVCTYGIKLAPKGAVDETFPQEPISAYGRGKVDAERAFQAAAAQGKFELTIIRPSTTYGPGSSMIDNLEFNGPAWDRIERRLPVLCAGDGIGGWIFTHRDDVGKLFAHAALNPVTFGQSYNATGEQNITWREYYRQCAAVLGKPANLLFMPAAWIVSHDPKRFNLLREITQFPGAFDSSKAMKDVPEYRCDIPLSAGAAETFADMRRRNTWKSSQDDPLYEQMISKALSIGVEPQSA